MPKTSSSSYTTLAGFLFLLVAVIILMAHVRKMVDGTIFPTASAYIPFIMTLLIAAGLISGEGLKGVSTIITSWTSGVAGGAANGVGKVVSLFKGKPK